MRPGGINYIYNISTGYHFKAPFGKFIFFDFCADDPNYWLIDWLIIYTLSEKKPLLLTIGTDVPKGKYFNPYFDHMIIGNNASYWFIVFYRVIDIKYTTTFH